MKKVALSLVVVAVSAGYVWSQWDGQATLASLPATGNDQIGRLAAQASTTEPTPPPKPVPFVTRETLSPPVNKPAPTPTTTADTPTEPPPLPKPTAPTQMAALTPASKPPEPPAAAPPPAAATASPPPPLDQTAQTAPVNPPLPHPRPTFNNRTAPALLAEANPAPVRHGAFTDGTYTGPVINVFYGLMQIQAVVQNGRLASINIVQYPNDRRTSVRINRVALPMLRDEVVTAQSANVNIISGATLSSVGFIRSLDGALRQAKA
jgi:uncharacterized protein with FMN-binding domain